MIPNQAITRAYQIAGGAILLILLWPLTADQWIDLTKSLAWAFAGAFVFFALLAAGIGLSIKLFGDWL
jgi:hypothetical protein